MFTVCTIQKLSAYSNKRESAIQDLAFMVVSSAQPHETIALDREDEDSSTH